MNGWVLAVDYGTSFTAAAMSHGGGPGKLLDLAGDGSLRIPSAVALAEDGTWLTGYAAVNAQVFDPDRFVDAPKLLVGEDEGQALGERDRENTPVSTLIAAVLERVRQVALVKTGGAEPDDVRLTYPATWGTPRRQVLISAAAEAGFTAVPDLIKEPVAAALGASEHATLRDDEYVAVYDLGGGTFDTAVLRRVDGQFEVVGKPGGIDPLGGNTFDHEILAKMGESHFGQRDEWPFLVKPLDISWRQAKAQLVDSIRKAKERVSYQSKAPIWIPEIKQQFQLTRADLERWIATMIDETIDELDRTVGDANQTISKLTTILLVGASSRIPMITERIWDRFKIKPSPQEDPKSVVALGATQWTPTGPTSPSRPQLSATEKRGHTGILARQPAARRSEAGKTDLEQHAESDLQQRPEVIAALNAFKDKRGLGLLRPEDEVMLGLVAAQLRAGEGLVDIAKVSPVASSWGLLIVTDRRLLLVTSRPPKPPRLREFTYQQIASVELPVHSWHTGQIPKRNLFSLRSRRARSPTTDSLETHTRDEGGITLYFQDGTIAKWADIYPPGRAREIVSYIQRRIPR